MSDTRFSENKNEANDNRKYSLAFMQNYNGNAVQMESGFWF